MTKIISILFITAFLKDVSPEAIESEVVNPEKEPPPQRQEEGTGVDDKGNKLFQGDIAGVKEGESTVRNAVLDNYYKWPKSADGTVTVPYTFHRYLRSDARSAIQRAIADYTANTCIRWTPRTNQRDYIEFFAEDGCWSYVGNYHESGQKISIGRGCEYKGTAAHEMMHALGFDHEQNRPDRDTYVTINYQNIERGMEGNFEKCQDCTTQNLPYDYSSVMHYGSDYFSKNGRPTIVPKQANARIGQRQGLTQMDFKKINTLYSCEQTTTGGGSGGNTGGTGGGGTGGGGSGGGTGGGSGCQDSSGCSSINQSLCPYVYDICPRKCGRC